MPSPISQNEKHINTLKGLIRESNVIKYDVPIKSLVVIANPKTVVNKKYAKKEIKEIICKYDNLTAIIKSELEKNSSINLRLSDMNNIADFLISKNTIKKFNLHKKYDIKEEDMLPDEKEIKEENLKKIDNVKEKNLSNESEIFKLEDSWKSNNELELEKKLREYRHNKAKELKIKPYCIFNNNGLENLIAKKPTYIEDLKSISGFGEKNTEKYGEDILNIINSN